MYSQAVNTHQSCCMSQSKVELAECRRRNHLNVFINLIDARSSNVHDGEFSSGINRLRIHTMGSCQNVKVRYQCTSADVASAPRLTEGNKVRIPNVSQSRSAVITWKRWCVKSCIKNLSSEVTSNQVITQCIWLMMWGNLVETGRRSERGSKGI